MISNLLKYYSSVAKKIFILVDEKSIHTSEFVFDILHEELLKNSDDDYTFFFKYDELRKSLYGNNILNNSHLFSPKYYLLVRKIDSNLYSEMHIINIFKNQSDLIISICDNVLKIRRNNINISQSGQPLDLRGILLKEKISYILSRKNK